MVESLYVPLVLLTTVLGVGFALFALRKRHAPGTPALTVFLFAASAWTLAEGLTVALGQYESMLFWRRISLSLSVFLPPAWVLFVIEYTGLVRRVNRRLLGLVAVEPLVFGLLVWTNDSHELVWSEPTVRGVGDGFNVVNVTFELAFWGHQLYSYLLLAVGMVLLFRMVLRANQQVRLQGTLLLGAIFLPATLNAIHIFKFLTPGLDPTGVGYVLAGIVVSVVALEPELARVAPATRDAGREAVLTDLDDAILILDDADNVLDINPAARDLFDAADDALGYPLSSLDDELAARIDDGSPGTIRLETDSKHRHFDLQISELSGGYGLLSGRVVSLRDVTERRQREQRLDVLNRVLRHNIRNELNVVRGKMELTQMDLDGDAETLEEAIATLDDVVARSDKVGRLSRLLESTERGSFDIATELRGEFRAGGRLPRTGRVELDLPEELYVDGGPSLVAAFDELVTNALVHNDSEEPHVRISLDQSNSDEDSVVLTVADNGPGIDQQEVEAIIQGKETPLKHASGVGLWLVQWLVGRVGGTLSFENSPDGCAVRVRLPRASTPG